MKPTAGFLHAAVEKVCPILSVSVGRDDDKATWHVTVAPSATDQQKLAAQEVLNAFDVATVPTIEQAIVAKANEMADLKARIAELERKLK
jgi:hypothetical protein